MSFTRLWAFLAIGLPVLAAIIAPFPSVDLTYHLRAGGDILETGRIPSIDTYTFTVAGQPWLDQQWLAQVVMAGAFRVAGWTGLTVLRALLVGIAFGSLFHLCRRRSGSVRVGAWLTLAAFVAAAVTLGLRPQLFAVALFAGTLWLVAQRRERSRAVWLVPVLAAAWANVHGSFVLAPVLVGLGLVEDIVTRRRAASSLGLLAATALATLVNPFGLEVWSYAARISTNSLITKRITEWQPTSPLTAEGALFFASVVGVAALLLAVSRRRRSVPWTALLWLLPFAVLGGWAVRGLAWWPFVAAATVATLVAAPIDARRSPRPESPIVRWVNAAIAIVLAVVAIVALPVWRPLDRGLRTPILVVSAAPSGITGALRDLVRPGDRILAPQPWGSWLELAFPDATVAVDSRIELFPVDIWAAVDGVDAGSPGWQATLDGWGVRIVVASAAQHGLADRLEAAGWRRAYGDEDGTVLLR